jgi:putative transcriptional regulator
MKTSMAIFDNFDVGKALIHSLEQAVEFEQGDKTKARVIVHEIPTPQYEAKDIVRVRRKFHLSQKGLALALNVSPRTVEAWETGKNKPAGSSAKLLYLIEKDKSIISQLVAVQ